MRDIFTYPNNGPSYIDPRYLGDDTVGFKKRVKDLMEGNIYNRGAVNPPQSVDDTVTFLGKYYNYYDNVGDPNISLWDFNKYSTMEVVTKEAVLDINYVQSDLNGVYVYFNEPHRLVEGDVVRFWIDFTGGPNQDKYLQSVQYTLAASEIFSTTALRLFLGNTHAGGGGWRVHRHGNGVKFRTDGSALLDQNLIWHEGFTEAHDTGSSESGSPVNSLYLQAVPGTMFSYTAYVDSGYSVPATLTEVLHASHTANYTSSDPNTVFFLQNISDTFLTAEQRTAIEGEGNGWCRIYYQNLTAGATLSFPDMPAGAEIGASRDYEQTFYWEYDSFFNRFNFYDKRGTGQMGARFSIDPGTNPSASVDIVFEIINPARITGDRLLLTFNQTDSFSTDSYFGDMEYWNASENRWYHIIDEDETRVFFYGGHVHQYLDSAGDTQNGAQTDNIVWRPGSATTLNYSTDPRWVDLPTHSLGFDTAGRLNSWTASGGKWDIDGTQFRYMQPLIDRADEYVPPAPTDLELAAAEDSFDTNAEWDTYSAYTGVHKIWPQLPIRSAVVNYKTPVISTYSQSGQKYVRSAGFTRWTLDVNYAPLTGEQFREMAAYAQLARGGAVNFYFELSAGNAYSGSNNTKLLGFERHGGQSNNFPRVQAWGAQIATLGGFASNETAVIKEGQPIGTSGGSRNGAFELALNNADANVFGEVKVKLGFNDYAYGGQQVGSTWHLDRRHVVVSMMEDDFQYTYRGDGLYDVSVKFELGMWT